MTANIHNELPSITWTASTEVADPYSTTEAEPYSIIDIYENTNAQNDNTKWVGHLSLAVKDIKDMIDDHLLAAINMIQRGIDHNDIVVPDWCKAKLPFLIAEAEKRKLEGYNDGWDK